MGTKATLRGVRRPPTCPGAELLRHGFDEDVQGPVPVVGAGGTQRWVRPSARVRAPRSPDFDGAPSVPRGNLRYADSVIALRCFHGCVGPASAFGGVEFDFGCSGHSTPGQIQSKEDAQHPAQSRQSESRRVEYTARAYHSCG